MSDQKKSAQFVIMNPLTGRPIKKTPSGMSLEGVTFSSKEELRKFVDEHIGDVVFMTNGKELLPPE